MGDVRVWGPKSENLLLVGLTGGIASGKSEVVTELKGLGAKVIDADQVARDVTAPGSVVLERIVDEFGEGVLGPGGELDRAALSRVVFKDESNRRTLNSITHPAIFMDIVRRVAEFCEELGPRDVPVVVIDAALIVDAGVAEAFDLIVVITASEETRVRRLMDDRGMSAEEAVRRIDSQVDDSTRIEMADLVIGNNGTLDELRSRVGELWKEISREAFRRC